MTMTWREIGQMPAIVATVNPTSKGVHESCLRAYNLLQKVKTYLARGVPSDVILELIDEAESAPAVPPLGKDGGA